MKFISRYTQLPEYSPSESKGFGSEITMGEGNWYDKAKAIETVF